MCAWFRFPFLSYKVLNYSLAEALDMQPPVMPEDGHTTRVTTGEDVSSLANKESSALEAVWDDEDTRAFYECLPDLRFVLGGLSWLKWWLYMSIIVTVFVWFSWWLY